MCIIDLSLCDSTQTGYPVVTGSLPGGGSYYYLRDTASQTAYGLTERRFLRKDLRPIANTTVARTYASNVLYEAALATLLNLKDRQTVYDVSVVGLVPGQVCVGDKIRVLYRGWVGRRDGSQLWLEVDEDGRRGRGREFYVLEAEDVFGDGVTTRLKINENAVAAETVEDLLANTIRAFEQSQIHVQPTASRYTVGPYTKRVSASPAVSASFSFKLGVETLDLWYCKLQVTGEPLKSSVTAAASGGGSTATSASGGGSTATSASGGGSTSGSGSSHSHGLTVTDTSNTVGVHEMYLDTNYTPDRLAIMDDADGDQFTIQTTNSESSHTHSVSSHTHDVTISSHTHDVTIPNHTHTVTYGVYSDSTYPDSLTIKVNGSTVASSVTLSAGNAYTYELDITSYILAAATLQQEHTITVEAASGRGEFVFQAQVLAVIQPIEIN